MTSHPTTSSPLLYGLQIGEQFKTLRSYQFESKDYQVTPTSPWNYALQVSEDTIDTDLQVVINGIKKGVPPFSKEGAPVMIKAKVGVCSNAVVLYVCIHYVYLCVECTPH